MTLATWAVTSHMSHAACMAPPPAANFTVQGYYGVWYELGKIQTAGGGYFEKDCVCTSIDIRDKSGGQTGDSTAINSCRKLAPTGDFLNATGQLTDMSPPGKWKEQFFPFVPKVDYTVIYLDEKFAIEYDCSVFAGVITNYCIHIMGKAPTADEADVNRLLKFAEGLGLNTDKLEFQVTKQENCW